ncbi:MAG TPA: penicillin-binding protein 2 [Natronosporangium sp.]|nr:penicillin-binding protein 2 [Natronosporangium sp.]
MATRRTGIAAARTYRPRGRTVREREPATPDTPVTGEPVRESPPRRSAGGRRSATGRSAAAARAARTAVRATPVAGGATAGRTGGSTAGRSRATGSRSGSRPPRPGPAARPRPATASRRPGRSRRPPRLAEPRRRLRLATSVALAMFCVLGVRLVALQVTDGPAYAMTGLTTRLDRVELPAPRGNIYDRNGTVLAQSLEARFVFADPELVEDPQRTAELLAPLLDLPASELAERMRPSLRNGQPSRFEWLARGVDVDTGDRIEALNLAGIGVERDEIRHVPGDDLAANLIGFTGTDLVGLAGLEASFDEVLRGTAGVLTYETGHGGDLARQIPGGYRVETPARPGSDLRLTIDADLQYEIQRLLAEHMAPAQATFAAAVVLDARTFEILAQASYPGYDASDPFAVPEHRWRDAATSVVFDPGSVHKPLVIGAALQEGVIRPGDAVVVDPSIQKGDTAFRDVGKWHPPGTRMTPSAILAFSSNVGTIRIADQLGPQTLYAYQQAFGLGEATGVGLPGEAPGALLAPEDWSGSSYGSVPIGHSTDATALQLAAAYGVIANDGTWKRPSLVQAVVAPDGTERAPTASDTRRVLSPEVAAQLRQMMEAVVTVPGATGTAAAVNGYRVAGKTGTGALLVDGQYVEGEVASFVGMAPAEAPRFVVAVVAHTPREAGGGEVAAPAFSDMMAFALAHYRVPPSEEPPPDPVLYR